MRFSSETVQRFADASRDFNPLHMSESKARTTPFGQRVVHGCCGVLASCGLFSPPEGSFVSAIRVLFYQPPFLDVDYQVRIVSASSERALVKLMDGSTEVMEITFEFRPGKPVLASSIPDEPASARQSARLLSEDELTPELTFSGPYTPHRAAYEALLTQYGVDRHAWGDALLIALMASSYLTGMEMPGERALYFQVNIAFSNVPFAFPSSFLQEMKGRDRRGMVKSRFQLMSDGSVWASGDMNALLLPPRAGANVIAGMMPEGMQHFAGKVAVVAGGSRGFGSSLALTLAAAGATVVILYARSTEDAANVRDAAESLPGRILIRQCDVTSLEACETVQSELITEFGRIDWLVCSSVPALHSLRVEPPAFERMSRYLSDGFAMVLAPLSCFAEKLADSGGGVLLISSVAVEDPPPPVWPHYVALKCAVEGLARTAATQYPKISFCVARPAKLLTDLVNTPMGRTNAENPAEAASRILSTAALQAVPGKTIYLR